MGEDLPGVVEAVAAFPGERELREEAELSDEYPADITAASAVIMFARPLLISPGAEDDDFRPLRAAVELATDPEFRLCPGSLLRLDARLLWARCRPTAGNSTRSSSMGTILKKRRVPIARDLGIELQRGCWPESRYELISKTVPEIGDGPELIPLSRQDAVQPASKV